MDDTTQAPNGQPTPATTDPQFGDHALNLDAYAAGFAAVRRAFPLREAEAAIVYIDHEAIAAWLGSSRVTAGGHWEEAGR